MTVPFFSAAPRPANEAERQRMVERSGVLGLVATPALDEIVAAAAALCATPAAALSIIDRDRQWFVASHGIMARQTSRACAFCAHAILTPEQLFCVPDAREDARFAGNPLVLDGVRIRFYAAAPLAVAPGLALGALCVFDAAPRACVPDTLATLGTLAARATRLILPRA
ncbi:GAF domain-containing protein [Sphingomonas morindae]|uniref:GAF domain-containing protein n=1 Tax=Sphingomonas morindae TaxID=1541170 RepID=A0ABY4XDF1_9SPHN|nr:GAF domain-containing protein [Sphingomonas morindae]USI75010.1 GAF domain-containing protein [Sphingomonas morindae]